LPVSKDDAFPTTQQTYIGTLLDGGPAGEGEACRYLMAAYAEALRIYLRGSSFRGIGDIDELVDGFFADRLSRNGFLDDWRSSRRRLRYWLIRAFKNYLLEQRRAGDRARRPRGDLPESASTEGDPEAAFHREAALSMVRETLHIAGEDCRGAGHADHWQVFLRHHMDGQDYGTIGAALNVKPLRAAVMARTAMHAFRRRLREVAAWPGASREDLDVEIRGLMEIIGR
jgi:DNA-directed RNA polymerase specialized sigma24 family protein